MEPSGETDDTRKQEWRNLGRSGGILVGMTIRAIGRDAGFTCRLFCQSPYDRATSTLGVNGTKCCNFRYLQFRVVLARPCTNAAYVVSEGNTKLTWVSESFASCGAFGYQNGAE